MTKEQAIDKAQTLSAYWYPEVYHVICFDTLTGVYGVSNYADELDSIEAYYNGEIYN